MSSEINRFKWACVNIKKETLDEAAQGSKLSRSLIVGLEKETDKPRKAGYENIKKLAVHYGVSMDWLCGILPFENWSIDKDARAVEQYTGLSSSAIEKLSNLVKIIKKKESLDNSAGIFLSHGQKAHNFFFSNPKASGILFNLYAYLTADFSMAYRKAGANSRIAGEIHRTTEADKKEFFPTTDIHFLIDAEYGDWTEEWFMGLKEDDCAEIFLKWIIGDLRILRKICRENET